MIQRRYIKIIFYFVLLGCICGGIFVWKFYRTPYEKNLRESSDDRKVLEYSY